MKLDDKIRSRKIAYLLRREPSIAFELALLYYIQAKRKTARQKKYEACLKSLYWVKKAEVIIPKDFMNTNPLILIGKIEKLLVFNRSRFYDRGRVAVGARMPVEALVLAGALV